MTAFKFFFSYAREDRGNSVLDDPLNPYRGTYFVDVLFDELRREVQERLGCPPNETGYRDLNIQVGQVWPQELAEAACRSCVLVPLLTPNYLKSKDCGREFAVFQMRFENNDECNFYHIYPIYWQSSIYCAPHIPDKARKYFDTAQLYAGALPPRYPGAIGLKDIWRTGSAVERLSIIIAAADRIAAMINQHTLPPLTDFNNFRELPSAFDPTEADRARARLAVEPPNMAAPLPDIAVHSTELPLLKPAMGPRA